MYVSICITQPWKSKAYFLKGLSVETTYNQQFQVTISLMVFDFQGQYCTNYKTATKVLGPIATIKYSISTLFGVLALYDRNLSTLFRFR